MVTPNCIGPLALTTRPHDVALPDRGDGVARALCETYLVDGDAIPKDMVVLLAAIDGPREISDPG